MQFHGQFGLLVLAVESVQDPFEPVALGDQAGVESEQLLGIGPFKLEGYGQQLVFLHP